MDLTFSAHKMPYLNKVYTEIRHQEETSETVVPDSYPDAASIADCFASVMLRGKECRTGAAIISGAVKGGVVYHPEDGSYPRLLEFYFPFSVSFDSGMLVDTAQITAELKVASVDSRMINSRKILLRVNVACEISAYCRQELTTYELQTDNDRLQTKTNTLCAYLPSETAERSFGINEALSMQAGQSPIAQIYKLRCDCRVTDRKLVGNKAVFKGMLQCKLLCRGENDILYTHTTMLPFSQYCELVQDYDEGILSLFVVLTGCDVSIDHEGIPQLSANLLAQCIVYNRYEAELVEDAYCVGGELTAQWQHDQITCSLDRKTEQLTLHQSIPGSMNEIIDTELYDDFPLYRQSGDTMQVIIPVCIHVFGVDNHHIASSRQSRGEITQEYALAKNAGCHARILPFDGCMVRTAQDSLEFQCGTQAEVCFTAQQELTSLCSGSIAENRKKDIRVPSVILHAIAEEQPLWNIAKAYKTTVTALRCANEIDSDYTPDHGMLLIPIP